MAEEIGAHKHAFAKYMEWEKRGLGKNYIKVAAIKAQIKLIFGDPVQLHHQFQISQLEEYTEQYHHKIQVSLQVQYLKAIFLY